MEYSIGDIYIYRHTHTHTHTHTHGTYVMNQKEWNNFNSKMNCFALQEN
jgi:hypothetical protein